MGESMKNKELILDPPYTARQLKKHFKEPIKQAPIVAGKVRRNIADFHHSALTVTDKKQSRRVSRQARKRALAAAIAAGVDSGSDSSIEEKKKKAKAVAKKILSSRESWKDLLVLTTEEIDETKNAIRLPSKTRDVQESKKSLTTVTQVDSDKGLAPSKGPTTFHGVIK